MSDREKKIVEYDFPRKSRNFNLVGFLSFFVIFATIGTILLYNSRAAGNDSLSLSPASGSYIYGGTVTLTVNEDSSDAINAVEADLTYNSTQLQFTSASCSSTFGITAQNTGGSGAVELACGIADGSVTGAQTVGTVSFTVIGGSSSSVITFASTSAIIDQSTDTNNWNGVTTGGTYTLASAPTSSITSPSGGALIHTNCMSISASSSDAVGLTKVEFLVNGGLYATDTTGSLTSLSFAWNTLSGYPNGTYSLTTKAFNGAGLSTTSSPISVKVNNGDINGDGNVTISDLSAMATNWDKTYGTVGTCSGSQTTFADGDLNEDNEVNITDLSILASNWGNSD